MMTNLEKGIKHLEEYNRVKVPLDIQGFDAFRALMNITMPDHISDDFFKLQDEIIKNEYRNKKIIDVQLLKPIKDKICLLLGDITLIKADAIVNACNSSLLGCFHPLHKCIDNAIHSYAGLQVRRDLKQLMDKQGFCEPNGRVKITKGYNLPCKYIFHTVGPIVNSTITKQNEQDLRNCYLSCLTLADSYQLSNIVFCSISTGLYGYPIKDAAIVAYQTVLSYIKGNPNTNLKKIIFNVFTEGDYEVYKSTITKDN
jgi:O-acetyl-ADP-ribose deacetylase (regulator of RNase III)